MMFKGYVTHTWISTTLLRNYCCSVVVPWGITPSLLLLFIWDSEKHYETYGETVYFDTFFLWALCTSRRQDDSKEHIFIRQWPLEDGKTKQNLPQWNINQRYQLFPYATAKRLPLGITWCLWWQIYNSV